MATNHPRRLRVSSDPSNYSLEVLHPKKTKSYNRAPQSMKNNFYLTHPDLTKGQKRYLWSICSVYSTAQMKQLIQEQFINQLFYEMGKGIIRTADWNKYLEYLADPSKRKHQFQAISPKSWKAPPDQYKYRYFRDHPVALPTPPMPIFVNDEIRDWTREKTPPKQPVRYVTRRRRRNGNNPPFPTGKDSENVLPKRGSLLERPHTSLGILSNSSSKPSTPDTYSTNFTSSGDSSTNGASDTGQELFDGGKSIGEGFTRPKSRIGSSQRHRFTLQ